MKSLYLRSGLALVCAALLNACGGGNGNLALSGTISGLSKPDLVLINKKTNERLAIPANTTSFVFTRLAAVDEEFDVEIDTQPTGALCTANNSSNIGKANAYTSYSISFSCVTNPWTLGGTVSGLRYAGLVLANGADLASVLPPATAGANVSFAFHGTVGDGSPYGVTVLSQPVDPVSKQTQVCTVGNPTGTMPGKDYLGLVVTCN